MDGSPPGSSVHGISQARILERVAISFSRESSWPKEWTQETWKSSYLLFLINSWWCCAILHNLAHWYCKLFSYYSESVSCSVMSDSLQPEGMYPSRLLCLWNSPGKNPGVGSPYLLQDIFPTQGSNLGVLHFRWILYCLSYQGSPLLRMRPIKYLNF